MCGIAGAINVPNASYVVQLMLEKLQSRGREAAGIVSLDRYGDGSTDMYERMAFGRVQEVFKEHIIGDCIPSLPGQTAIGHVRYTTSGDNEMPNVANIQPLVGDVDALRVALVHNGNLTNVAELRAKLGPGAKFNTTSDSEIILHLLARTERNQEMQIRLHHATRQAQGAYTQLLLTPTGLHAVIDPYGFRPLVTCRYKGGVLIASEESAFRPFPEATDVQHILPNSLSLWGLNGQTERWYPLPQPEYTRACSFETLYFSNPASELPDGRSVQTVRKKLGRILARKERLMWTPDLVTAVPDSSNALAVAYAAELGAPHEIALIRSHETGRTFMEPKPADRELGVRMKFNVVRDVVRGKRITVVDDSIVRGTTMRKVIRLLRDAGAAEVHIRIGSPRVVHPCFWGIDTPNFRELLAADLKLEDICTAIGADSLEYLTTEEFLSGLDDTAGTRHCSTCFTGIPPVANEPIPAERLIRR